MTQEVLLLWCVLLGLVAGLGLLLVVLGLRQRDDTEPTVQRGLAALVRWTGWHRAGGVRRIAVATGLAVGVGGLTGWPVGGVLAAGLAWWLPRLVGPDTAHTRTLAHIEAIATWTEMLRDTLSAAAGLEQAVAATARTAPDAIRVEVTRLATRVERGSRLSDALAAFAQELADPTGDLVVAALVMAAQRNARQLTDLLGLLATTAREQASMRLRIASGRARVRTSVRVIVVVTLVMAAGLVFLNRGYLAPYDDVLGQVVLLAVGGLFFTAFTWLTRMSIVDEAPRLLTDLGAVSAGREAASWR